MPDRPGGTPPREGCRRECRNAMRTVTRELFRQGAWVVLAVGVACGLQAGAIRVVGAHAPFAPLPF
ncbi:hypothetical protein C6Q09_27260 [Burkholderia multivorans]|nr:hypothetical protein C6Q09_27260 [Burkholderia multivorans]